MTFHGKEYDMDEILRDTFRESDNTGTMLGDQIQTVFYRKGQTHDCDEECLAKDHNYRHDFDDDPGKMMPLIWFESDNRTEF